MVLLLTLNTIHALSSSSRKAIKTGAGAAVKPPSTKFIDMGQDKLVEIFIPPKEQNRDTNNAAAVAAALHPSSVALARMMAHCPALIESKNVLELQCGLGLVSATACKHARPDHVAVTDRDSSLLSLAYAACTRLQRSKASVSRSTMDWTDRSTWPNQKYDLLLASDILSEQSSIAPLTTVLQYYLSAGKNDRHRKRALIVDPVEQVHRDAFCYAARRVGLDVDVSPFPGMKNFVLLDIFSKA
eukprot:scaffold1169_cov120-Cylindrotheca_fusiformis.AAC.7